MLENPKMRKRKQKIQRPYMANKIAIPKRATVPTGI